MHPRTSQAVPAVPETPVIPFPGTTVPPVPETDYLRQSVQTSPCVGGETFRLTYLDAELHPRIEVTLDVRVPEEERRDMRRLMKAIGDGLPTRPSALARFPLRLLAAVSLLELSGLAAYIS